MLQLLGKRVNVRFLHFALAASVASLQASLSRGITLTAPNMVPQRMKVARFTQDGTPENMYIEEIDIPKLRPMEILIKVHSTAVNRADTLQRAGRYPAPKGESDVLGLEAAGEVVQVDESYQPKWNIGDKVMALLPGGGNAEYVAVDCRHVMPVPKSLSLQEAGGVPEVWLTAYQLIHSVGQLRSSDMVLIHAGASGVGTAAVQLVKLAGAKSITTAGTDSKVSLTKSLGASTGFNYKTEDWKDGVLKATDGKGVNLVLDCVGGTYWEKNADVLAVDGRWVLYGLLVVAFEGYLNTFDLEAYKVIFPVYKRGGPKIEGPLFGKLLMKRISLLATTLRARDKEYKAMLVDSFINNALPHFDDMRLKPVIETVFNLNQIGKAHALMETNSTTGKILLKVIPEGKVEL